MEVTVYGKPDCKLCEAAKEKLQRMGVGFSAMNIEQASAYHDGWRNDGSLSASTWYYTTDKKPRLPVVVIDGECMSYPEAIRRLKVTRADNS